jgi:hypothetical protein
MASSCLSVPTLCTACRSPSHTVAETESAGTRDARLLQGNARIRFRVQWHAGRKADEGPVQFRFRANASHITLPHGTKLFFRTSNEAA